MAFRTLSLSLPIYIYISIYLYLSISIYIYIYYISPLEQLLFVPGDPAGLLSNREQEQCKDNIVMWRNITSCPYGPRNRLHCESILDGVTYNIDQHSNGICEILLNTTSLFIRLYPKKQHFQL